VKGELHGEYKAWWINGIDGLFDNSQLWEQKNYVEGKLHGEYKEWNKDGKLKEHCFYKDGKLEGEWVRYINGKLNILSNYKEGKLHGKYTEYKEDGTYLKECFYTECKLINLITYNTSGHLELKKSLINYDTYELSRYYECDGKLHYQVIMEGDKWNGEYKSWWHNGNKCIETTYKDDEIHGEYTYWNEDGTLREKKYYNEGMIELNNSNFYISPTNYLNCDIKDTIVVLFYSENCCKDFLPKFKNFSNITKHIKYAMCDIEKYPEVFELNKKADKSFKEVPSIFIYYKGSPFVRYDGELDDKKVLEFIKEAHFKATFDGLNRDINNMINKV
jgi:antitoxin component YwqK of YwqJK toxin-antitoxin module